MQIPEIDERREEFFECGMEAIRAGKMAAVLLAGGMGTRLGSSDPKGMYDVGISRRVYIFERLVTNLLAVTRKAKQWIHLLIMTSDKNDEKTIFQEERFLRIQSGIYSVLCAGHGSDSRF